MQLTLFNFQSQFNTQLEPAVRRHPADHDPAADHVHLLQPADRRRHDRRRGEGVSATDGARSRRNNRVGVKEVARAAGVSVGTVSNVLNRPEVVRHETRFRVQAEMARLGLRPRRVGAPAAPGPQPDARPTSSSTPRTRSSPTSRAAPRRAAEQAGLALFLCNSNGDAGREDRYLDLLHQQRVLGILITALDYANPRLQTLPEQGTPVVLVDHPADIESAWCSVAVDDKLGGELAVAHLLEQGHERIAFAGGPLHAAAGRRPPRRARAARWRPPGGRRATLVVLETDAHDVRRRARGRGAADRPAREPAPDRDLLRQRPGRPRRAPALHARGRRRARGRRDRRLRRHRVRDRGRRAPDLGAPAARTSSAGRPTELLIAETTEDEHEHRGVTFVPELMVRASTRGLTRRSVRRS